MNILCVLRRFILCDLLLFFSNYFQNQLNEINYQIHDINSSTYNYLWLLIFIKIYRWYENSKSN